MRVVLELQQEDAPRLAVAQRRDLPRLAFDEVPIQLLGAEIRLTPAVGDAGDFLNSLQDLPFQGVHKEVLDKAGLVLDAGDRLFDLLGSDH
jgi:hypothetical protein